MPAEHEEWLGGEDLCNDVMDEGDIAQDYQSRHNRDAIGRQLAKAKPGSGPSAEICEECGKEIPPGRREAQPGCRLCVACQSMQERLREGL